MDARTGSLGRVAFGLITDAAGVGSCGSPRATSRAIDLLFSADAAGDHPPPRAVPGGPGPARRATSSVTAHSPLCGRGRCRHDGTLHGDGVGWVLFRFALTLAGVGLAH